MRLARTALAVSWAASLLIAGPAVSGPSAEMREIPEELTGRWRNPQNSVHIEIRPCGASSRCGYVIWANERAQADARRGGTQRLMGLELFHGLVREREGLWRGRVFVPDLNSAFSGTAQSLGSGRLRATGCLVRGVLCRSQTWTQVEDEGRPPGVRIGRR